MGRSSKESFLGIFFAGCAASTISSNPLISSSIPRAMIFFHFCSMIKRGNDLLKNFWIRIKDVSVVFFKVFAEFWWINGKNIFVKRKIEIFHSHTAIHEFLIFHAPASRLPVPLPNLPSYASFPAWNLLLLLEISLWRIKLALGNASCGWTWWFCWWIRMTSSSPLTVSNSRMQFSPRCGTTASTRLHTTCLQVWMLTML